MIVIGNFITLFSVSFAKQNHLPPWEIAHNLTGTLLDMMARLDDNYDVEDGVAIHKTANVEKGAILKGPIIIGEHCFIGSNAYLRGGVYLGNSVKIGTGCEIKTCIIFCNSTIAHFNFIGDSIIGSHVNFEAGAVVANHYNERENKHISIIYDSAIIHTKIIKFGALVGDHSKIGANAVLSPGTILPPNSIVKRLELIDQLSNRTFFVTK